MYTVVLPSDCCAALVLTDIRSKGKSKKTKLLLHQRAANGSLVAAEARSGNQRGCSEPFLLPSGQPGLANWQQLRAVSAAQHTNCWPTCTAENRTANRKLQIAATSASDFSVGAMAAATAAAEVQPVQ
jgi:hypothetical protein